MFDFEFNKDGFGPQSRILTTPKSKEASFKELFSFGMSTYMRHSLDFF